MIYAIPYILYILFLGFLAILYHQRSDDEKFCRNIVTYCALSFIFFFGFRGFINTDWMVYYLEFEKASWDSFALYELGKSREPGFLLFVMLNKSIVPSYHFFIFTQTLLHTYLLFRFFRKYSDNVALSLLISLVFEGFTINANLIRNSTCIYIFLNAIPYIYERKPLQYYALCLLAISFHFSGFAYLPLYFFLHRKLNRWVYLSIFTVCILIFILHIPIFLKLIQASGIGGDFVEMKVEGYTSLYGSRGIGLGFFERLITGILVFCYYRKIREMRPENTIFINSLVLYYISVYFFSEFAEISKRIFTLFIFSYWILWCDIIRCFYYERNRYLFCTFVGLYCLIKTATNLNAPIHEYDNLLLGGIKSFQERKYIFEKTFKEPEY